MRNLSITVVLVILAVMNFMGCKGDPDSTGVPIYSLPINKGVQEDTTPQGPVLNSIVIEPAAMNIEIGGQQIFKAYGYYSDNAIIDITGKVTWYSTNLAVGTISDKGVFNALGLGYSGIGAYIEQPSGQGVVYADYGWANVFAAGEHPPAPVRNVKVKLIGNAAYLTWNASPEPDIKGYNVYRTSGKGYVKTTPYNTDLITLTHWEDTNPGGGILFYVVAAVNEDDTIGAFSAEVELDFTEEPIWED
jgi:hypothetical protein